LSPIALLAAAVGRHAVVRGHGVTRSLWTKAHYTPAMLNRVIAAVASVYIIVIAVIAKVPTYHINPIFLLPFLWLPYFLRRRIDLRPGHYLLFALAIGFHDLGAFGFYQHSPFPWSFDIYVHFYFAFAIVFILHHALVARAGLGPWPARVTTLLFMMGLGALHEIMEYMTYLVVGEKNGMLKPSTSYFFDTQRDLTNNLLGTLTALVIVSLIAQRRRRHRAGRET
jgi:uncharacterized membrane protein YjdF